MNFGETNHYRDLNHYPHSIRYQSICGIAFIVSSIVTIASSFLALGISYMFLIIYIMWMLFTIICPEIRYLIYASKDKIYYLKKHTYDGEILGSICDGMFASTVVQLYCSVVIDRYLLKCGIFINPYYFLVCPLIVLIPFVFICTRVTSIKTKVWSFFKYMFFCDFLIAQVIYFVIGIIEIFCRQTID